MDTILEPQILEVIKDKSNLTPAVRLILYQDKKVIWKDYSNRPWWVRKTWGEVLANNEFTILRRLQGIKGIPHAICKTPHGLLIDYVEGQFLNKFRPNELPYAIIGKLENLIGQIHSRYIVHLDLAQRKNILISSDFNPYIIDFANAFFLRPKVMLARKVFNCLRLIDRGSLLKFKNRYFPDKMTIDEKKYLKWFWAVRKWWFLSPKTFRDRDNV
jgi:RIO-like serine/threonine protein kinase